MTGVESAWPRFPDYRIDLVPCRGTGAVRVGGTVLARSDRALRIIETDHVERLYFPVADVRVDLLHANDHRTVCPFKGVATYWTFRSGDAVVEDIFWTYGHPLDEVGGIAGHIGVYHEKPGVEVDIETQWPDGGRSANRFPAWGDEEDLIGMLDVRTTGPWRYTAGGYRNQKRNVVEGGQLVGQAIVAASDTVPGQRVTWVGATFARPATFSSPLELSVDDVRTGRTFSTRHVRVEQAGKLVAPVLVLADSGAPDCIRDVRAMPAVGRPADAVPLDMGLVGRDIRVVDGAYDPDPDRIGPPELHVWIRHRDDPSVLPLRQALIAQSTTHWAIATAMRPHSGFGEAMAHVSLSTGPVALSVAFHDDRPLDEWLLYTTTAVWSGRGSTQGEGRVYSQHGDLLATYSLQAMIRDLLQAADGKDASVVM